MSYKHKIEEFVSNQEGTSVLEIAFVVSSAPIAVWVRNMVLSWLFYGCQPSHSWKTILDFILLILPVLAAFTVMANHLDVILTMLIFTAFGTIAAGHKIAAMKNSEKKIDLKHILSTPMAGKRPFISGFRAYVNIATAISILAVDFVVFPRRFAKAETYGTGLMDVGVGAFVISNAIVSPEARGKYTSHSSVTDSLKSICQACLSTGPLVLLGVLRLAAVKSTDYQEHVSEYGVHWNFFFTLAVVRVLSSIILSVVNAKWSFIIALCCGLLQQYLLSACGMREYILLGEDGLGGREGLLNANREGICSCLGYLSVYFVGVQLGAFLFKERSNFKAWFKCALLLISLDVLSWVVLALSETYIEPVSRRMANISFILWMIAYNLQLLPSFLLVELIEVLLQSMGLQLKPFKLKKKDDDNSKEADSEVSICLLEAVNRNGLLYFILANVLTGTVNFLIETIYASNTFAMIVLIIYMFILSAVMSFLHIKNITVKFW